MSVQEIFDWCPGDILIVSLSVMIFVPEIFDWCNGDIWCVSWRYL